MTPEETDRLTATTRAIGQERIVELGRMMSHQDSVVERTQTMHRALAEWRTEDVRCLARIVTQAIDVVVGTLGPLERDVGASSGLRHEEVAGERDRFLL